MLDEEQIEEERRQLVGAKREKFRELLRDPHFREFCLSIIKACDIFNATFISSSENFFRQGRRSVGIEVLNAILDAEPEQGAAMIAKLRKGD